MENVKLSELPSDTMLSYEASDCTYTPEQLRELIQEDGDYALESWQVCTPRTWKPNADSMLRQYIECEYGEMYEDWDDDARLRINEDSTARIQAVLDEMFGEYKYWIFDGPEVIIDTLDQPNA
ncbi:hypothetical protein [Paenibacillus polymyxa]|uniref:hypothetical protein n=1 Tax=Paenibacillus polymyxa TaxID=1406 RepID=UPI000737B424|nr:hypothetical protein [Paenibacillus polymyxa]